MLQAMTAVGEHTLSSDWCSDQSILAGQALTPREYQAWSLMTAGWSDAQIADLLFLNPLTVRFHLTNAIAKLGTASRREEAALARRSYLAQDCRS